VSDRKCTDSQQCGLGLSVEAAAAVWKTHRFASKFLFDDSGTAVAITENTREFWSLFSHHPWPLVRECHLV